MSTHTAKRTVLTSFAQTIFSSINDLLTKVNFPKQHGKHQVVRIFLGKSGSSIGHDVMAVMQALRREETEQDRSLELASEACRRLSLPGKGEQVYCLWRPWRRGKGPSQYLYATMTTVDGYRLHGTELQAKARGVWFEGGGIASKEAGCHELYMGHIARLECVEVLLRQLRWLSESERETLYQLAFPGQAFPDQIVRVGRRQ